ncbi:hypothetical protein SNOG_07187 [Parastagonospora nodorum SN15]|uniref:Uncharacterized protein n=1 Tax=Phaeosphaeria nodorum (strain SN15 / ATCC MYA-4574 / FGSC 10173) TaxID=321614 RepID=Q0UM27_PHANO|nr:hypothetical protein SNOG_07187 [Parastagonospora nodorum SN15]EAT85838.1 hypothetical protein SNOG_07187 [Parastagonospora nodorum SN15]
MKRTPPRKKNDSVDADKLASKKLTIPGMSEVLMIKTIKRMSVVVLINVVEQLLSLRTFFPEARKII